MRKPQLLKKNKMASKYHINKIAAVEKKLSENKIEAVGAI